MVCNPRTGKPHDTGSRQQYNGRTPEDWLMRYDEKRWADLRAKRKAGPPLTANERDEWDMLNAERLIILGRARRQAVATRQRKRRNAIRMELGALVLEAGLENMDRGELRRGLEALTKHSHGETAARAGRPRWGRPARAGFYECGPLTRRGCADRNGCCARLG